MRASACALKELGYPDLVAATWFALSGPAKLPSDITHRLNAAVVDLMKDDGVRQHMAQEGIEIKLMTPEELTAFVQAETARWTSAARRRSGR